MNIETIRRGRNGLAAALAAAALLANGTTALAGPTPEQKCEAGKNQEAGKYAACIAKAEKQYVKKQDTEKYGAALCKCAGKYTKKWQKIEEKAGEGICPSEGDGAEVQAFLDACAASVAEAVGGGGLPLDVATCNAELSACEGDLGVCEASLGLPATGQTTSYGAGSDGDVRAGLARLFTDNGDGTITDNVTGLMWEKKDESGGIHDKDNTYTWSTGTGNMDGTIVTTFLATLNAGSGFAGYTDWRVPNLTELESLRNLEVVEPATYSAFNHSCTSLCTVTGTTCSCTRSNTYWSSSTYHSNPSSAWYVYFNNGATGALGKTLSYSVRAVRAGS